LRKSILRFSRPLQDKETIKICDEIKEKIGIRQDIQTKLCKSIQSPMMTGFFKPILLLPYLDFDSAELKMILRHEFIHYKRKDIWYKLLLICANAVHWFNPMIYFMIALSNKNIEMVCDSEVLRDEDISFRKKYGQTILSAVHKQNMRKLAFSTYFYGGKKVMKERFVNIFDMKKKHRGVMALCILLVTVCAACALVACQDVKAVQFEPNSTIEDTNTTSLTESSTATTQNISMIAQKTKEYILTGQNGLPEAGKLQWSEAFLNQVNIEDVYRSYISDGGKADDIANFAIYLTKNAPVPNNWKELFEADLSKEYGEKVSRYEALQDDLFQVYVKKEGSDVPYVV
jgi:hypothetical protein